MVKRRRFDMKERGQSLTEVALILPILVMIIAGVIEISNLIVGQSRVDTAVRTATRFGANGGVNPGMRLSLLQAVTPTLDLEEQLWDVWVVRGVVNETGNDYVAGTWEMEHIYGTMSTTSYADFSEAGVQAEVLENLQLDATNQAQAANVEFVGMLAYHQIPTILGLDNFIQGFNDVRSFGVMRISPVATANQTAGCHVYPFFIEQGIRSVAETSIDLSGVFPSAADIEYPASPPAVGDFFHTLPPPADMFNAKEGYIFYVPINTDSPNGQSASVISAHWDWNSTTWEQDLKRSLTFPGNSSEDCNPGRGWYDPVLGCDLDRELHVGDPIAVSQSASAVFPVNVKNEINEHIHFERTMRVMLYDHTATSNIYHGKESFDVTAFAIVRPLAYDLRHIPGKEKFILFEFLRIDESCGQQTP